jgi:hypothetical protein
MKKNGYDYDECCYEEMTDRVGGQSQPQPCYDEPFQNEYEMRRNNQFDQSGMKGK